MTVTKEIINRFNERFHKETQNKIVACAISSSGINAASLNQNAIRRHNNIFSDTTKMGEITSQKQSGRCWMFAALNTARVTTMNRFNMKTLEFSQNYTLFWDKLEKSNYFLDSIIETVKEDLNSRLVSHLLTAPLQDGGQWDMFKGILKKYGIVPKYMMPETFHSSDTAVMADNLTKRLRRNAKILREAYRNGKSTEDLTEMKEEMLYEVYNILVKCLGEPPVNFDFEYLDSEEVYHADKNLSPIEFFNKYVGWNLDDKISIINAPTEDKPYEKMYSIKYLGSVKEATRIKYLNLPIEELKKAAIKSIQAGEPVWFGCDVGKHLHRDLGIMDLDLYDYDNALSEIGNFTKADRLNYGESMLTHAMVFTGVDLDENGKALKWRVENSWGEETGQKGIFSMTDEWFDEYNYQIMVDKKYLDKKYHPILDMEPVMLEPWDPFGALAF